MIHKLLRHRIILIIILIIIFYSVFAIYSDIDKIKESYKNINLNYLTPIIFLLGLSIFLRSIIQKILLNQIGISLSFIENFMLFLAGLSMIVTPIGSGQMIKSQLIKQKYGYSRIKSLPLVFAERYYDLLAVSIVLLVSLIFYVRFESVIIFLISISIVVMLLFLIRKTAALQQLFNLLFKIKFFKKTFPEDNLFRESLSAMFRNTVFIKSSLLTIISTFIDGFIIYFGFLAFNVDFEYLEAIQMYYTSLLFGVFSFIPGGVGVMEGSLTILLTKQDLALPLVTALVIFIRLTTIWLVTILGFISTYLLTRKNREK